MWSSGSIKTICFMGSKKYFTKAAAFFPEFKDLFALLCNVRTILQFYSNTDNKFHRLKNINL